MRCFYVKPVQKVILAAVALVTVGAPLAFLIGGSLAGERPRTSPASRATGAGPGAGSLGSLGSAGARGPVATTAGADADPTLTPSNPVYRPRPGEPVASVVGTPQSPEPPTPATTGSPAPTPTDTPPVPTPSTAPTSESTPVPSEATPTADAS